MAWCDRAVQTLLAIVGAFAAFSLMTIAIATDYWLYSRAYICNATNATADETQMQAKKVKGDMTHSGLWRICCIEGKTLSNKLFTSIALALCLLRALFFGTGVRFFPAAGDPAVPMKVWMDVAPGAAGSITPCNVSPLSPICSPRIKYSKFPRVVELRRRKMCNCQHKPRGGSRQYWGAFVYLNKG